MLAVALSTACGRPARVPPVAAGGLRGFNVLLVTIDTLRADHVGAYGSSLGATPTLDRFAAEGLRFDVAHAHVPMTLPSHTTIMTGLLPCQHGVRDNGLFRVGAQAPTLVRTLSAGGYATGAFVGAFVLDSSFGLAAGFDTYRDVKSKSGKPVAISLVSPPIDEVLTIQDITISEIDIAPGLAPRYTVTASSVRFSLEALLRSMNALLDN